MTSRRPGRVFWLWTAAADVLAPGTGKRRINSRMQELYEDGQNAHTRISELASEVRFLRRELHRVEGQNNMFLVQDEMNLVPLKGPPPEETNQPVSNDTETTIPLHAVNKAMANAWLT